MSSPATKRIDVIDAIRGFAVLGILLANIQSWSGYKYLPFTEIKKLPYYELDALFYWAHSALVDGKFYAIFSMLFGVGFGLQWERKGHEAGAFLPMYRRRLSFLLLFGILHALLWSGDILTLYALLAFVLVALRDLAPRSQLRLSLLLLCFFAFTNTAYLILSGPAEAVESIAHKSYPDMSWGVIIGAFGSGSWSEIFAVNLHNLYGRWMEFLPNGRISRVLGFFLLGCYLSRIGFFSNTALKPSMILVFCIPGIALTVLAMKLGLSMGSWPGEAMDILSKLLNVAGQLLLALGYMCILTCLYATSLGRTLMHPLTLIGRTAFTSYLSQSVIGIAIFYGVGFGLIGTVGLAQLWLLALAIYAVQVAAASLWLKSFKQGPVEWVWRCLTQKRYVANLRPAEQH